MMSEDDKLENILADPRLAKPRTRWSVSIVLVMLALFFLKPVIIDRLISRAEAYSSYSMFNNVERECQKALFLDGDNIRAWNLLGDAYDKRGDITNAVNTYLNAININPANKIANFRLGMIYTLDKNYKRAIPHFELIRILGPESSKVLACDPFSYYHASLEMLSLCYEKTGRTDKMNEIVKDLAQNYSAHKKKQDVYSSSHAR